MFMDTFYNSVVCFKLINFYTVSVQRNFYFHCKCRLKGTIFSDLGILIQIFISIFSLCCYCSIIEFICWHIFQEIRYLSLLSMCADELYRPNLIISIPNLLFESASNSKNWSKIKYWLRSEFLVNLIAPNKYSQSFNIKLEFSRDHLSNS